MTMRTFVHNQIVFVFDGQKWRKTTIDAPRNDRSWPGEYGWICVAGWPGRVGSVSVRLDHVRTIEEHSRLRGTGFDVT